MTDIKTEISDIVEEVAIFLEPAFFGENAKGWTASYSLEMRLRARVEAQDLLEVIKKRLPDDLAIIDILVDLRDRDRTINEAGVRIKKLVLDSLGGA